MPMLTREQHCATDGGDNTALGWPDYPLEALHAVRQQIDWEGMDALKEEMIPLADFLARKDVCSFVLPKHGKYLADETPAVLSPRLAMPAERFILEYQAKDPDNCTGEDSLERRVVWLLLVRCCPKRCELTVMDLVRIYTAEPRWSIVTLDFKLAANERIEFKGPHAKLITRQNNSRTHNVECAIRNGGGHYRLLAHFLMLYNSPHISTVRVEAAQRTPNYYTVLRCDGPTPFAWLPASGMTSA